MRSHGKLNRRNSLRQAEVSAPGLLPYEGKVWRDEAEGCCLCSSNSQANRNPAGAETINTAPEYQHLLIVLMMRKKYKIHTLVTTSRTLFNIVSMIKKLDFLTALYRKPTKVS